MVPGVYEEYTKPDYKNMTFPFLSCKKPDQNWSQVGGHGSGAKYNLEDLWSPQGGSQHAFFSILNYSRLPNPNQKHPKKPLQSWGC